MKIQIKINQIVLVFICAFSTLSFAEKNPSLPPAQTQGQTQFISGGIGKDESEAILQARGSWPLMLELTQAADPSRPRYISDVRITIKDELNSTVLDTTAEGPYLLVKLPAGKYSLDATYNATTLYRKFNLQEEPGKKVTLTWPAARND